MGCDAECSQAADTTKPVQYFDANLSIDGGAVKHDKTEFKLNTDRPTNNPAMQADIHPYPLSISEEDTEDVDKNHNTYVVTLLKLEVPTRGMTAWGKDLAGVGMHFNEPPSNAY
jgi:hypothetical protein